jgi:DNA-binding winged helix-turn-helix (wHTH) protein
MPTQSRAAPLTRPLLFAPFRFDTATGQLWLGDERVAMRPKTRAVLAYLLEHRDRYVSRDELCRAIWPGAHGAGHAPKQCIRELRLLLDDAAAAPRFLETAGRDGYRFIARIEGAQGETSADAEDEPACIGREPELGRLDAALGRVRRSSRSVTVLLRGEPGVGKSTLIDAFVVPLDASRRCWVARAECAESLQGAEPYAPILAALMQLARAPGGEAVVAVFERYAPSWLALMPGLVSRSQHALLERRAVGVTSQRMSRELALAFEDLTASRAGILVLEDLQWCDTATLDWLAAWARGRNLARLLVVGTLRGGEQREPALRRVQESVQESVQAGGHGELIELAGLPADAVEACLRRRYDDASLARLVARTLDERTRGHPLFLFSLLDDWHARGLIMRDAHAWHLGTDPSSLAATTPESINQLIETRIAGLDDFARLLLEAASIAGLSFAAATVAAAQQIDLETAEDACERLARHHGLLEAAPAQSWPDGTVSSGYAFRHVLYQQALAARIPAGRRAALHRRIAARLEAGYGPLADGIATELAGHFEAAREFGAAARYGRRAGELAMRRHAPREAAQFLRRAVVSYARARASRSADALEAQVALGAALLDAEGFGSIAAARAYRRAYASGRRFADMPLCVPAFCGLWNYCVARGELGLASVLSERLAAVEPRAAGPDRLAACNAIGQTHLFRGEPGAAQSYVGATLARYAYIRDRELTAWYGEDPGVVCHMYAALTNWLVGRTAQAHEHLAAGSRLAGELAQPGAVAQMGWMRAVIGQLDGDAQAAYAAATALIAHCAQNDVTQWMPGAQVLEGWARAMLERDPAALGTMQQGIDGWRAAGVRLTRPYSLGLLAEARAAVGDVAGALAAVDEALSESDATGERWYAAALCCLKGELLLRDGGRAAHAQALRQLGEARALATGQGVPRFARRAEDSLRQLV